MQARRSVAAVLVLLAVTASGCGGSDAEQVSAEDPASTSNGAAGTGSAGDTTTSTTAQLFSSDFDTVCAGASQSRAAAYQPGEPGPHPMILLQGSRGELYEQTVDVPDDWRIDWQAEGDALAGIQLVVCSTATPGAVLQQCSGYEDSDGKATGQTVDLRAATYDVSVRAAATGDEVAHTTVTASDDTCPLVVSSDTTEQLATDNLAIVEFLTPIVQG